LSTCPILLEEGIRTLGTALFSVHQAIAASQGGCLYISPYYNGKRIRIGTSSLPVVNGCLYRGSRTR
jgi:transaldolase